MDHPDDENWLLEDDEASPGAAPAAAARPWRVLVVDDDADVHAVTRLALRNVSFKGRALELLSASSAAEGFRLLQGSADIALVLLDVVMESDDAGLVLVRRIREELHNHTVRVVLRTGQPGQAPEQRLIVDYDISDYKAKTELTTERLFTAVISALRAYETLTLLERSRAALGSILDSAASLYQAGALRQFASGVLGQVGAVLDVGAAGMLCVMRGAAPAVLVATGVLRRTGCARAAAAGPSAAPGLRARAARAGQPARAGRQRADDPHPPAAAAVHRAGPAAAAGAGPARAARTVLRAHRRRLRQPGPGRPAAQRCAGARRRASQPAGAGRAAGRAQELTRLAAAGKPAAPGLARPI
jgi:CheY-like chemotaxis protein